MRASHGVRNVGDISGDDEPLQAPDRLLPPDGLALGAETRRLIEQAIAELPVAYRTVFALADIEGMPNAEVADRLDMTLPAVKSRLHRAPGHAPRGPHAPISARCRPERHPLDDWAAHSPLRCRKPPRSRVGP